MRHVVTCVGYKPSACECVCVCVCVCVCDRVCECVSMVHVGKFDVYNGVLCRLGVHV